MTFIDTFAIPSTIKGAGCAAKEEVLVDLHKLLLPEIVLVKDISREHFGRHTAREILNSFARESAFNSSKVLFASTAVFAGVNHSYPVSLGVCLFHQWQPGLILVLALSKVEGFRPSLAL